MSFYENERKSCIFIWKIESFSSYSKSEEIASPSFFSDASEQTPCYLKLRPGQNNGSLITCSLRYSNSRKITAFYAISLFGPKCSINLTSGVKHTNSSSEDELVSIERSKLFEMKEDIFPCDTLNVRCQIWENQTDILRSSIIVAKTVPCSISESFVWKIKSFSTLDSKIKLFKYVTSNSHKFEFSFRFDDEPGNPVDIEVKLLSPHCTFVFVRCNVSLLDGQGIPECSKEDERRLVKNELLIFPSFCSRNQLLQNATLYLPNDELTVRFKISAVKTDESEFSRVITKMEFQSLSSTHNGLHRDLASLYSQKEICDVTLQAGDQTFRAHKIILSSRSRVFRAMFQTDMRESVTGVVQISDIDPVTLDKLLLFMYSDSFKNLQYEEVLKLYAAANKYEILYLKEKCSLFLLQNASLENLSEILALADTYQDTSFVNSIKELRVFYLC